MRGAGFEKIGGKEMNNNNKDNNKYDEVLQYEEFGNLNLFGFVLMSAIAVVALAALVLFLIFIICGTFSIMEAIK